VGPKDRERGRSIKIKKKKETTGGCRKDRMMEVEAQKKKHELII